MYVTKAERTEKSKLEAYFAQFRQHIVGIDQEFESPYGTKNGVYGLDCFWTII